MDKNNTENDATVAMTEEKEPQAPSQKIERTEKEKAEFALKKNAERLAELGGDPAETLNIRQTAFNSELDDNTPLTIGSFKEMQKKDAQKSALQMANELPEDERDEVRSLLETRIVPSGNAEEDLRLARAAVNATHNAKIAEHISNRVSPKKTAAGGSSDSKVGEEFVPTPEEARFMQAPYNLTKEQVLAARK